MSIDRNPLTDRYLEQLGVELDRAAVVNDERKGILAEIESHLAESVTSGGLLQEALEKLGPAEELARAYAVELALNPRRRDHGPAQFRILKTVRRVSTSVAALLLVLIMGGVGLAFALSGAGAILAGLVAPFVPSAWLDPTLRAGLPQLVVIAVGLALLAIGVVSLRIVHLNARLLFRALRNQAKEASQ